MHLRVICIAHERDHSDLHDRLLSIPHHMITLVAMSPEADHVFELAREHHADVVLLDPALDDGHILAGWRDEMGVTPVLICCTSTDAFAVPAFSAGAVHYLSDPTTEQMAEALDRATARIIRYDREGGNGHQARETRAPFACRVVALPSATGIEVRTPEQLVSAHGEGGYTRILLEEESPMLLSRSLGEVEPMLRDAGLLRVHRSHMINPQRVRRVRRGKTSVVELVNGLEVDVSDRYRGDLFDLLQIKIGRRQDQA